MLLNATATTEIYPLSLHDALPIFPPLVNDLFEHARVGMLRNETGPQQFNPLPRDFLHNRRIVHEPPASKRHQDRKSTRLNSSHVAISYAVFCLKKKKPRAEPTVRW